MIGATGLVSTLVDLTYLVSAVLFILGLKRLSSPATARGGNLLGAVGMLLAVLATLIAGDILSWTWILVGIVVGSAIGAVAAQRVQMTAMPQMVAIFNGFGGGASVLVAAAEYLRPDVAELPVYESLTITLSVLIGAVTFSGSFVAFAKLQELMSGRPVTYPLQKLVSGLIFAAILGIGAWIVVEDATMATVLTVLAVLALVLGVLLVIPIGGADMPVVVALLNSYSGLAAAMTGFVLSNYSLIITGALVGASGLILTRIMCVAMNRSLTNVLFGAFGGAGDGAAAGAGPGGEELSIREAKAEDVSIMLGYASSVVFVPGYGMAVAQAQHTVREVGELLAERGVDVKYAVHAVAGRMPGHMNVLLAEAGVDYDRLYETEEINSELEQTDVAVIIGANDVVNPAAETDPSSPLWGMPIIQAHKAKQVIVLKRSMRPGFAGVENPLFYLDNTSMFFGDAKDSMTAVIQELKQTAPV